VLASSSTNRRCRVLVTDGVADGRDSARKNSPVMIVRKNETNIVLNPRRAESVGLRGARKFGEISRRLLVSIKSFSVQGWAPD
jgi:hypothetical protein